jgi:hypothetical protein
VTGGVVIAWIIAVNLNALDTGLRKQLQDHAAVTRAFIDLSVEHEGEPWLDPEARLGLTPTAREIPGIVREHGSPLEDSYFPSVIPTPSTRAYAEACRALSRMRACPLRRLARGGALLQALDRGQKGHVAETHRA